MTWTELETGTTAGTGSPITAAEGATLASATSVTLTDAYHSISGTTQINTFINDTGVTRGFFIIRPTGAFPIGTSGNIVDAPSVATVDQHLLFWHNGTNFYFIPGDTLTITSFANALHTHANAAGGGQLTAAAAHSDYAAGSVAYSAGNFTAESGSWTVDSADQSSLNYARFGPLLLLGFEINNTDVSATPTYLQITLPLGLSAAAEIRGSYRYVNAGGAESIGMWVATGSGLRLYRDRVPTAWSATSSDNTSVVGSAVIRV